MKKIKIITDSASDICFDIPENVKVLPMTIRFGEEEYRDGVTISHQEFYNKLIESNVLPATSLISPGDFSAAYETAAANGEIVIVITVSSKLSGTYQSAVLAANNFPGTVFVVDSLNASIGEQILVRYAAQLAELMETPEEIVEELNKVKQHIHTIGVVDTLEYLKKGGRVSSAVALVGEVLSIKPVLAVKNGEVVMLGKARGSKNRNNFLNKEIGQTNGIDFTKPICLGYTGLSDAYLQKYILDSSALYEGHREQLRICSIGATIGTHIGPGAVMVSFFAK